MSIGAAPNASGGLWMDGMSVSMMSLGNGSATTGFYPPTGAYPSCGGSPGEGGNGGGNNGGASGGGGGWGPGGGSGGDGGSSGGGGGSCSNTGAGGSGGGNGNFTMGDGGGGGWGPGGGGSGGGAGSGSNNFGGFGSGSLTKGYMSGNNDQNWGYGDNIYYQIFGSLTSFDSCGLPAGGETPPAVTNNSSAGSTIIVAAGGNDPDMRDQAANGIPITCAQTGLTLNADSCSATFYVPTTMVTYDFTAQGGTYVSCDLPLDQSYIFGSGSGSGFPGSEVGIRVTVNFP